MSYALMEVDGVKVYEYALGQIVGTNAPSKFAGGKAGIASNITVTVDVANVYSGISSLNNSFWSTNSLTWTSRAYSELLATPASTVLRKYGTTGAIDELVTVTNTVYTPGYRKWINSNLGVQP